MAAWLISALRLLLVGAAGGIGFEAGQRALPGGGTELGELGVIGSGGGGGMTPFRLAPFSGITRRRRRRRALTHQDKDDIAFLAATVGETTARKFALILAAHSSR